MVNRRGKGLKTASRGFCDNVFSNYRNSAVREGCCPPPTVSLNTAGFEEFAKGRSQSETEKYLNE